ncbi:MAG: DUF3822 family protein [Bacteroidales bacterium]|jgi:hypothetical protein|nr:DUF3822 family protein [Bacteroidales bacterium]
MFLPENIDLAHSEEYNLSIRLTPDGFSFSIHSPADPSVFHFQGTSIGNKLTYIDHIKKLIFDLGFFSQPFRESSVTLVSPYYTLVPAVYHDKGEMKKLFRFNFHEEEGIVLSDASPDGAYHVVFNLDEEVHSFLSRNLWNSSFHHHTTSLLQLFEGFSKEEGHKSSFIDFHDTSMTIICFSGEQLLSANTFPVMNAHDTTYFIASVWEKLAFDQRSDRLYLSGNVDSQKAVTDILKKLIRHVENVALKPAVQLTDEERRTLPTDIIAALCV